MALAIDASTPAVATGTTAAITTASFTTPAAVFLLALVGRNVSTAATNSTGTVSGAGLTWARAGQKTDYASATTVISGGTNQPADADVWWAYSPSALTAQTVTDTRADALSGANREHALQVMVLTGAETTWGGAIGATAASSGLPSLATTTTAAGAWMFSVSTDWLAKGAGTAGAGQTIINDYTVTGNVTVHFWRQTASTATPGTSVTENLTAPSAEQYNMINVEVRPAAGGSTANPLSVRAVIRVPMIRAANY